MEIIYIIFIVPFFMYFLWLFQNPSDTTFGSWAFGKKESEVNNKMRKIGGLIGIISSILIIGVSILFLFNIL
ncbi:hypothetical protein PRVXT_000633 [Proteinivorax tanatarense]|uniref:Protein-export membrane protein SecG n=1 Tax=Proteinivorax tanatarense TaxID=1260629 RepID=A0AAU7VNI3_9FIRM